MNQPLHEQVMQAADHLVTVEFVWPDMSNGTQQASITGLLRDPMMLRKGYVTFGVTSGYRPGDYDAFGNETIGSTEGLGLNTDEVVSFTDHGARDDFETNLRQLAAQREHALQALKDAEANLKRAYAEVTNLTAQEG